MGGFSSPTWLRLGEMRLTGTYNIVLYVCLCVCDRATDHLDDDSRKIFECFCVFEHVEGILFKRVRVGTAIV